MEEKELTPMESLSLITSVIEQAKSRFCENGFSFIFLGICIFIAALAQFILLELKYYSINYIPYFIMPVAGIVVYFYYRNKRQETRSKNIIGSIFSALGIFLGINVLAAGFFFWSKFGITLIPFMLIMLSIWLILFGTVFKNYFFIVAGILLDVTAFGSLYVGLEYHPLVLSIAALIGVVLPGAVFNFSQKKSSHV